MTVRYYCPKCDEKLSAEQDLSAPASILCPVCGMIFGDPFKQLREKIRKAETVKDLIG